MLSLDQILLTQDQILLGRDWVYSNPIRWRFNLLSRGRNVLVRHPIYYIQIEFAVEIKFPMSISNPSKPRSNLLSGDWILRNWDRILWRSNFLSLDWILLKSRSHLLSFYWVLLIRDRIFQVEIGFTKSKWNLLSRGQILLTQDQILLGGDRKSYLRLNSSNSRLKFV